MKFRTIPAGITWTRTGRLSSVCTIRREPETFVEWEAEDYAAMNQAPQAAALMGFLPTALTGFLPSIGTGQGLLSPLFGDSGL